MAVRIRLSSLVACLVITLAAAPPLAQEPAARPPQQPAPPAPAKPIEVRPEDCKRLPGGKAPIARLARIEGGISVRNLEMTYLGKPLFELTADDYAFMEAAWPVCGTFDAETAPKVARRIRSLVDDAKAVRRKSLDWIKATEKSVKALKPGQESIQRIHDLWQEMLNREFEMTQVDLKYIAGVLEKRRDELYTAPQGRQRTLVSPFDPGPPPDERPLSRRGG